MEKNILLFIRTVDSGGGAEKSLNNLIKSEQENKSICFITLAKENYRHKYKIITEIRFLVGIRKAAKGASAIIASSEGLPYLYILIATVGLKKKKL